MEVNLKQPLALVFIIIGSSLGVSAVLGPAAGAGWMTGLGITLLWIGN